MSAVAYLVLCMFTSAMAGAAAMEGAYIASGIYGVAALVADIFALLEAQR